MFEPREFCDDGNKYANANKNNMATPSDVQLPEPPSQYQATLIKISVTLIQAIESLRAANNILANNKNTSFSEPPEYHELYEHILGSLLLENLNDLNVCIAQTLFSEVETLHDLLGSNLTKKG